MGWGTLCFMQNRKPGPLARIFYFLMLAVSELFHYIQNGFQYQVQVKKELSFLFNIENLVLGAGPLSRLPWVRVQYLCRQLGVRCQVSGVGKRTKEAET
jgi:hypothetical protein